ncbi:hypothetical protein [Bradyrhizobium sp.]|uniref:hypothetical protein n=1 Tax=Bradyrhizobium sp. TaxID=376 RepID=UPI0039E4EE2D
MSTDERYLERIAELAPQLGEVVAKLKAECSPDATPVAVVGVGLAKAVIEHFDRLTKRIIRSVFEFCEDALDGSTQDLAALSMGFLESLQDANDTKAFDFTSVIGFLGPKSREHCSAMDRFWKTMPRAL